MDVIKNRLTKASFEMSFASKFDKVIINDNLENAKTETLQVIKAFLDY